MNNIPKNPLHQFANIDIYLFDQLLKGTYEPCRKVLDAGCGSGRNLAWFLNNGYEVYGADTDPRAIADVQQMARHLGRDNMEANFLVTPVETMPFEDASFELVISSAVLHFANNATHFDAMLNDMWRVLKSGGYLFVRLASDIGIETLVKPAGDGRYILPDGSTRFLVNQEMLLQYTSDLGGQLHEPIKTTNVQNLRCMTTWCLFKTYSLHV